MALLWLVGGCRLTRVFLQVKASRRCVRTLTADGLVNCTRAALFAAQEFSCRDGSKAREDRGAAHNLVKGTIDYTHISE